MEEHGQLPGRGIRKSRSQFEGMGGVSLLNLDLKQLVMITCLISGRFIVKIGR